MKDQEKRKEPLMKNNLPIHLTKTQRDKIETYAWDNRLSIAGAIRQLIDNM
ncbi:MAG: hypothetical protein P8P34_04195 [Flavobacteriaceae bacterium]|nr:hypothetical protein [Flavobacteriaceae bacterium]